MPLLSMDCKKIHIPVMVNEVMQLLNIKEDGIYVDATLGCGGHSLEILKRLSNKGILIGLDRDKEAICFVKESISDPRIIIRQSKFSQIKKVLADLTIEKIDGILFDLGVSMLQLKDLSRGFSFYSDEKLDMRMDKNSSLTAWEVVNKYPEKQLIKIFIEYGNEPFARKIARKIVREREEKTIDTCRELADLVKKIIPKRGKIHPSTKIFQAIRIEVNKELEEISEGLKASVEILKVGGRVCLISYHSGEDRLIKNFLKEQEKKGTILIITKKPIVPSLDEITRNPSSRSARLRGGEKL